MKIRTLFIFYTVVFFIELIMLAVFDHLTIPLLKLAALTAIVLHQLPWYGHVYLLIGVSLSSYVQGFSVVVDLIGMALVIIGMATYFYNLLVHHIIAQTLIIVLLAFLFMAIDCTYCLTVCNILATILITPIMLQFLR